MMRLAASVDPPLRRVTRRESRRVRRMVPVTEFRVHVAIIFVKSASTRRGRGADSAIHFTVACRPGPDIVMTLSIYVKHTICIHIIDHKQT